MDRERMKRDRDARIRKDLLGTLHLARRYSPDGDGFISGRTIFAQVPAQSDHRYEDEEHCLALLDDLIGAGYAAERDNRTKKTARRTLHTSDFRITPKGVALEEEKIACDPLIDDGRIEGK